MFGFDDLILQVLYVVLRDAMKGKPSSSSSQEAADQDCLMPDPVKIRRSRRPPAAVAHPPKAAGFKVDIDTKTGSTPPARQGRSRGPNPRAAAQRPGGDPGQQRQECDAPGWRRRPGWRTWSWRSGRAPGGTDLTAGLLGCPPICRNEERFDL